MMKTVTISPCVILFMFWWSWAVYAGEAEDMIECLAQQFRNYSSISNLIFTKSSSSYTSVLEASIWNRRFASESTPKPEVIITPEQESQIPPIIHCTKQSGLEMRTRSGGHDLEGLSYAAHAHAHAHVPFVVVDLINLSEISVDVGQKTAWVGGGATIGSLYYKIAERSPVLGFPAGVCPTVGVGGHFSGGGYGTLMRKHGLAADNVVDARIVGVDGRVVDRKSMGEDVFWAIRGGGGASYGVVVAWKVQLVDVPERVTVFAVGRTLEQNATRLVHRWQYVAPKIDKRAFIEVLVRQQGKNPPTIRATFMALFLGGADPLLALLRESFPELGVVREDCTEASWVESVLLIAGYPIETPLQTLIDRTQTNLGYSKTKSNYVQDPIPEEGFRGMWRFLLQPEAAQGLMTMIPYGGRMEEISESALPFPHRAANLYMLSHVIFWPQNDAPNPDTFLSWSRTLDRYLTPYVSKFPRAAYFNYRDLDIGLNNLVGNTSYAQATEWGFRYFHKNFHRLAQVKTKFDPQNFFRNEQSIPTLHSS